MGVFSSIGNFFSNALGSAGHAITGGPAQTTSSSTSSGTSNSSSTRAPWEPVQSSVMDYIKNLPSVYNNPQISAYEQSGYDALSSGVDRSAGALDPAIAENNKTLSGYYLNPDTNPYIKQIADRMGGQAMAGANATFGGGGRTGSGIHQEQVGEGIANAVGNVYYGNYSDERGRQGAAVGMAPQLSAASLVGPQALINAGQSISARPYDINSQLSGILTNLAQLGGTTNSVGSTTGIQNGSTTGRAESPGVVGNFINKLFA